VIFEVREKLQAETDSFSLRGFLLGLVLVGLLDLLL